MTEDPERDLDLEAWEAQAPPSDFAARVMGRIQIEARPAPRRRRVSWRAGGGALAAVAIAAAIALRVTGGAGARGEAIARERTELSIGSRARAVLEPGAELKWDGDDVVQAHGDVFYRVEPGARFRVHTPAGDVEVKGTCFAVKVRGEASQSEGADMNKRDVKSGAIGAAIAGLSFVAVYEGKVAVSHAGERVELGAGESAQSGSEGVHRTGALGAGEKQFDEKVAAGEEPLSRANESLVTQVGDYRRRLEAITAQKVELEQTLRNTEQKLASRNGDGSAPKSRADFDLGAEEWKELAKDGTIKFMIPCKRSSEWTPSPETLQKFALAPHDAPVIQSAYAKSNQRLWATIKPLCAQALGSAEVAEKVGVDTCIHLVLDQTQQKEKEGANEAMRIVSEIRAGQRPAPGPNEPMSAVTKMFLALTGEMKVFESDLAQALGPEEAHRIVFAEGMCVGRSTLGGPGPRDADKK